MTATDAGWPPVGATVTLVWTTGRARAQVQRAGDDVLTASREADSTLPAAGTPMQLEWSDASGLRVRRVSIDALDGDRLRVYPDGAPEHTQRRQFFRAATALAAVVHNAEGDLDGFTMDLSESGVRLRLGGHAPGTASPITTDLVLEGQRMSLPGRVVRHDETPDGPELGVAFDELPPHLADVIRREVFNAQLMARRERS